MNDSFISLLPLAARTRGEDVFATFSGEPITFGQLHRESDAVALGLRRSGLRAGQRVAVMMRNSPSSISLLFGIAKAGGVWVAINVEQRGGGLRYLLEHSSPTLVFVDDDLVSCITDCGVSLPPSALQCVSAGRPVTANQADAVAGSATFDEPYPDAGATFLLGYTSGTTGRPKGVQVTHRMLRYACDAAMLLAQASDGDVFFVWEPLYHIGGAQLLPMPLIRRLSLAMVPKFSASQFWKQVVASGATRIHYLGGILQILLRRPEHAEERQHGVTIAWGGGCPREIWRDVERRFGLALHECYGMTEASSIATVNDASIVGSVGRPVPWIAVSIHDAQGKPLPAGVAGEIVIQERAPGVLFSGYFRNPEASAAVLRDDGFRTGDRGMLDADGHLYFLGRLTDSIRVKGENVSAFEVENVALDHPDVEDCAMVGVLAEFGEQDIKLFIKPKTDTRFDVPGFSRWIAGRVASYQNPRFIALVDEFDRTPSQRIIKRNLMEAPNVTWDRCAETDVLSNQGK